MRTPAGPDPRSGPTPSPRTPDDEAAPAVAGARADELVGAVLEDRYRIDGKIARGGMSTVYRGVDLRLDRPVAIKVMSPAFAADPAFLARFEREARAAAKIDDPHVVGVYDQGRDGDDVFLVMELVEGGTLRDLLHQRGALPVPEALAVLEPLLAALAAAHAAGLVHRDVKPENVLISPRGEVKVADFGLVRAVTSTTMATGNVILGTVAYLSPEQVETGAADERSDVYAAGIVAHEMLTGHPPYHGDNPINVAYQHVHSDVPPVADAAPSVPAAIAAVIDAATSRDPAGRPVDAAEFLAELRAARAPVPAVAVPTPRRHRTGARIDHSPAAGPPHTVAAPTARASRSVRAAPRGDVRVTAAARRRRRLRATITIALLILATAAALGGWWLAEQWTSMPDVVGDEAPVAASALADAGLDAVMTTRHDDAAPAGTVVSAEQTAGARLRKNADVGLVVSGGRPEVPAVRPGSTVSDAARILRAADLTAVTDAAADVFDDAVPAGDVVATRPDAGAELTVGATVLLIRSKGPAPTAVPDVADKLVEDAENKLLVAGFEIGPQRHAFDPDTPPGTVLGTAPEAGATAPRGSEVSLVLSISKQVPAPTADTVTAAAAELVDAGFKVSIAEPVFDAAVPGGHVVRIDPVPGTRIDPADPLVTLTGSSAVTVPAVTGMPVSVAQPKVAALGLTVRLRSLFGGSGSIVFGQDPDAGALVAPGSEVVLTAWP